MSAPEATIHFYKKGEKIYPRRVKGVFNNWRVALVLFTQAIFYLLPWLQWNERQAFLLDLGQRKFYIFGWIFWPQDVLLLALLLILSAYSLFLFTTIAGRLFCGYACPQTVYTQLFSWVERKIEGDRNARIALDKAPISARKLRLRITKHLLWIIMALWTSFTFVGYFSPIADLGFRILHSFELGGWEIFWLFFYAFATWGNAGFMRENVCLYMCPYARFQSVMYDQDTFVISYDTKRGEPRAHRNRKEDRAQLQKDGKGDCIDCGMCVQVCPTGIDIRKGLQYECIGCGACIDACDTVMQKMNYPKGLIRYSSEYALSKGKSLMAVMHRLIRPRVIGYSIVWLAIVAAFVGFLGVRSPLKVDVIHDRGSMYSENADGSVDNSYQVEIINTKEQAITVHFSTEDLPGSQVIKPQSFTIAPLQNRMVPMTIRYTPPSEAKEKSDEEKQVLSSLSNKITLVVTDPRNQITVKEKTRFLMPE